MFNRMLNKEILGNIMATARVNSKHSQKDMAKALGVSVGTISNWEQGIGAPNIMDLMEWFEYIGDNALRPLLDFFYPSTFIKLNSSRSTADIRKALIKYITEVATDDEIRKLAFNIFGESGSSWHAQLDMLTAHNHTTMKSRVNAAQTILDSYEMEKARDELVCLDHIMPDEEYFKDCVAKGKKSVFEKRKGYI